MLVLTDSRQNGMKRWARMYGCTDGWNIAESTVLEILSTPDTHPSLSDQWQEFVDSCKYRDTLGQIYDMHEDGGDLFLIKESA